MGCGYGGGKDGAGYCSCVRPGEGLGMAVIRIISGGQPASSEMKRRPTGVSRPSFRSGTLTSLDLSGRSLRGHLPCATSCSRLPPESHHGGRVERQEESPETSHSAG